MKKLNGKLYFEKPDIVESKKDAIFYLIHTMNHEFFISLTQMKKIVLLMEWMRYITFLSGNFMSETAINIDTIERCYKSLRVHSTCIRNVWSIMQSR